MITKGAHYNRFLKVDNDYNKCSTRVTKVVKTKYGYRFQMFNTYITLFFGKLYINEDETAKCVIRVEKNYQAPYQYTLYFDNNGFEIKTKDNSTRKELFFYKELRKQLNTKKL